MKASKSSIAAGVAKIDDRVAVSEPIAFGLAPEFAVRCCNFCFRFAGDVRTEEDRKSGASKPKLLQCAACRFVRYCSRECQKADWRATHKLECELLRDKFSLWTDLLPAPRHSLALFRLLLKMRSAVDFQKHLKASINGMRFLDFPSKREKLDEMSFGLSLLSELVSITHQFFFVDVPTAEEKKFAVEILLKLGLPFEHSVVGCTGELLEVGVCFDLSLALYEHSCRPSAEVLFCKNQVYVVPLQASVDAHDVSAATISHVPLFLPAYERKLMLSESGLGAECGCERCSDADEAQFTAIRCFDAGCTAAILINDCVLMEKVSRQEQFEVVCSRCLTKQPWDWISQFVEVITQSAARMELASTSQAVMARQAKANGAKTSSSNQSILNDGAKLYAILAAKHNLYYADHCLHEITNNPANAPLSFYVDYFRLLSSCIPAAEATPKSDDLCVLLRLARLLLSSDERGGPANKLELARAVLKRVETACGNYFIVGDNPVQLELNTLNEMLAKQAQMKSAFPVTAGDDTAKRLGQQFVHNLLQNVKLSKFGEPY